MFDVLIIAMKMEVVQGMSARPSGFEFTLKRKERRWRGRVQNVFNRVVPDPEHPLPPKHFLSALPALSHIVLLRDSII